MPPRNTRSASPRVFESLQSAAERTGFSVFTLRDKIASGALPAYRISDKPRSAIRVKITDVDALFKPLIPSEVWDAR